MDAPNRVAANVRRLRKEKEWSQEEFADRVGIHRTYVSALERAQKNVTVRVLDRIADALGVDPGELVRRSAATKSAGQKVPGKGQL